MNLQEIFDKVATHLITQGEQSLGYWDARFGEGTDLKCSYRGADGTMCAAGCLIPDDEYSPAFEGMPWGCIADEVPSFANEPFEVHSLIKSLQGVHDYEFYWSTPERLKDALETVANRYGLSSDILN